jgi:hypothetical protein
MNTHAACHAAPAIAMLNMAMLVREKRVSTITIAHTITTAAVTAEGIANGEKWYADIFLWTCDYCGPQAPTSTKTERAQISLCSLRLVATRCRFGRA